MKLEVHGEKTIEFKIETDKDGDLILMASEKGKDDWTNFLYLDCKNKILKLYKGQLYEFFGFQTEEENHAFIGKCHRLKVYELDDKE